MKNYNCFPWKEKIEKLRDLFSSNSIIHDLVERCSDISHIDDHTAIFHIDGDSENCYKYVVDPNDGEILADGLVSLVKRGIKTHYDCRNFLGVQYIVNPGFHKNIIGLIGPLEYISGNNLKNVGYTNEPEKRLNQFEFLEKTLAEMHKKEIMHRDVKPGNIVEDNEGNVKFIDFSISSSFIDDYNDRLLGWMMGTFGYLHNDDLRSRDHYALGVSFVQSLLPEVDFLITPIKKQIDSFDTFYSNKLGSISRDHQEFFRYLINKSPEYLGNFKWVKSRATKINQLATTVVFNRSSEENENSQSRFF